MKKSKAFVKMILTLIVIYILVNFNIISFSDVLSLKNNIIESTFAFFLLLVTLFVASYKWWILLKSSKYDIPYKMSYYLYTTGLFFNIIMPGSAGGDIVKGIYLFKYVKNSQRTEALSTIILDRLIGLHALLAITFFSLVFSWNSFSNIFEIKIMFYGILFLLFFIPIFIYLCIFFSKKIVNFLNKFNKSITNKLQEIIFKLAESTKIYKGKIFTLLICYFLSTINHVIQIFCFFIVSIILFGNYISLHDIFACSSLSLVINVIPLTPGGIGLGEGAFNFLLLNFSEYSTNLAYGSIFFITYRVLFTLISLTGAYSFVMLKKPNNLYKRM